MKKLSAIIMVCILFVVSLPCVSAGSQIQDGFVIEFNGNATEYKSIIINNTHYVPMRLTFEKMGAAVYYRSRDGQTLALSRDGDIIRHYAWSNIVDFNGKQKTFNKTSVLQNGTTYIPLDMVYALFCPNNISCDNNRLNIQKQFSYTNYHKDVGDVLSMRTRSNFYPEKFQAYIGYHTSTPYLSMDDIIYRANMGLYRPFYENVATIEQPYMLLVLVNKYNKLPSGFSQYNLVNMNRSYTVNDGKQYLLAKVAYEKFVQMSDAAKKSGLTLKVISAYRTESYQSNLYNNKLRTTGKVNADNYSARPGYSEHQTGLAVDINSTRTAFETTAEYSWLQKHAYEYGFILRYPKGKEWITGYAYEPWHYRYVGTDIAKKIHDEGINTYEEFYARYMTVNEFK